MRSPRFVLATFVFFMVAGGAGGALAGDGSNLLQYLPPTATVVLGVDVDAVRTTGFWSKVMDIADDDSGVESSLRTLQTDASFDPRATAHTLVAAVNEIGSGADDHAILLIELEYPREGLAQVLLADQYEAGTVGEITYYRKGESTVAFLSDTIVAVGSYPEVLPGINVAAGQGTAGVTGAVAVQLAATDRSKGLWIAAGLPSSEQGAQAGRATIDFSAGLAVNLTFQMVSAERATAAADELRAQLTTTAAQPEMATLGLADVIGAVQVTSSEADLVLSVDIDASTWSTLLDTLTEIAQEEIR